MEGEGFLDVFDQGAAFGVEEGPGLCVAVQHEELKRLPRRGRGVRSHCEGWRKAWIGKLENENWRRELDAAIR